MKPITKEKIKSGELLANRGSMPALDLNDYLKRMLMEKIASDISKVYGIDSFKDVISFSSDREKDIVRNYRSEKITLERLCEMMESLHKREILDDIKMRLVEAILIYDIKHMMHSEKVMELIYNKQIKSLNVDFLVGIYERLTKISHDKLTFFDILRIES